ncbi:ATP-binding cassette permease mdl2 [Pichia californica]|uniref:ATP-binding cassette permease mdl2 n=1 Tax=Pichia californica TaxID=460514 RepID=A0A9P6WPA2_9ASCO|nr:ATP-binding cassette permease mdl2 [[Candida] californica]
MSNYSLNKEKSQYIVNINDKNNISKQYFAISAKTVTKALKPDLQAKASRRYITEVKVHQIKNGETVKVTDLSTEQQQDTHKNNLSKKDPLIKEYNQEDSPDKVIRSEEIPKKRSWKERLLDISHDDSNTATFTEVWRLLKLGRRDLPLFILAMILLTLSASIVMALPKVTGLILDATKNFTVLEDIDIYGFSLDIFLYIMGGLLLLSTAATFTRIILMRIIGENLVSRLRSSFMKNLYLQDMTFYDKNKVGDLISRLSSDAYVVSKSITQNASDGIKHSLILSSSLTMMFILSTKLSLVMLAFSPPLLFFSYLYGLKIRSLSRQLQQATGALTKVSEQQLNSIRTIQSFTAEVKELHHYNNKIRRVWKISFKDAVTNATFFGSTGILGNLTFLLTLGLGTRFVLNGSMTVGDLTAYLIYTEYCGSATFGISNFYTELFKGAGAASRLFEMLDIKPSIDPIHGNKLVSKANISKNPVDNKEIICKGHIKFENVGFTYPTRPDNQIFKKLSFDIPAGSNVCIVGPSGRGKSTIASLLLRFYQPNSGKILIDGQNINDFSVHSVRQTFGFVQQEPVLIEGTIDENIRYGLPPNLARKITYADVEWAAQKANCDFIYSLRDGFNTNIGPRGSLLSGGQRQKVALARCLIKEPPVLILDEATSALDGKSESAINETLERLMRVGNMTTISIAHRLSTIERCEDILVLGYDGSIVEHGKFRDLWADKNSRLWKLLNTTPIHKHEAEEEEKATEKKEDSKNSNSTLTPTSTNSSKHPKITVTANAESVVTA